jgi:hypothetical protein
MAKLIQEHIGERAIEAFAEFARSDIPDVATLEATQFAYVADFALRKALAQVYYGSRWIYKLGLVMLVKNEERAAHVRAQILDYASICEALLSYTNGHAIDSGNTAGSAHLVSNPDELVAAKRRPIKWQPGKTEACLRKQSFWWQVRIAREFGVITPRVATDLNWLREERNAIHVRQMVALGATAYLKESKRAFETMSECIQKTKVWLAAHP